MICECGGKYKVTSFITQPESSYTNSNNRGLRELAEELVSTFLDLDLENGSARRGSWESDID